MNILELDHVTHRFPGGKTGIFDISLNIGKGAFTVIAGTNGSGKTTLLRHFNGLLTPHEGDAVLDGISIPKDPARAKRLVGMVFQDADSQIVGETVFEDVAFGPENLRMERSEITAGVWKALSDVGLVSKAESRPHTLSGGEKRRLAIAGIIVMKPSVVVFDEPFANLDYPGSKQVLTHMLSLHANGCTIIVSTHDLEKVIVHADQLVILESGRIAAEGLPEDILPVVEHYGVRTPCRSNSR